MSKLETFEIRFGRAEFSCGIGFKPHIAIGFGPLEEKILVPLPKMDCETTCLNLAAGKRITYSTPADVWDSPVILYLLEKNDYGEYQKISESYFQLENGFYSNDVAFASVYDKTFELGTIYVMAEIKETVARKRRTSQRSKAPSRPVSSKSPKAQKKPPTPKLHRGRPQPPSYKRPPSKFSKTESAYGRPKSNLSAKASQSVLDETKILKSFQILEPPPIPEKYRIRYGEDVGALYNPPPMHYVAPVQPRRNELQVKFNQWKAQEASRDEMASILDRLKAPHRTVVYRPKIIQADEQANKTSRNILDTGNIDRSSCPLVAQIIDELNNLNAKCCTHHRHAGNNGSSERAVDSIKALAKKTPEVEDVESSSESSSDDEDSIDAMSTSPMISAKSISEHEIKQSASTRLRQDLPSGTYDRFGRPTLKPVFSDLNTSLKPGNCSSTSLLAPEKRRSSLNVSSSVRPKSSKRSLLPMNSYPVVDKKEPATNPMESKLRSVTTQTTDNSGQKQPALTSETLFAFDIHEKKETDVDTSQEIVSSRKSSSEKTKRPRSSVNISIPTAKSYATTTSISSDKKTENYSDDDFSSIASPRSIKSSHAEQIPVTKSVTEFQDQPTEPMSDASSRTTTPRAGSSYADSKSVKTETETGDSTDYSTEDQDFDSPRPPSDKTIPSAPVRSKSPVISNRRQRR